MFGRRKQCFQLCSNVLLISTFLGERVTLSAASILIDPCIGYGQKILHSAKMNFMCVFVGLILNPININTWVWNNRGVWDLIKSMYEEEESHTQTQIVSSRTNTKLWKDIPHS